MTDTPKMDEANAADVFAFFTEMGIITQLATALLAKSLPDGVHPSHFSILNHLSRLGDGKTPVQIAGAMQVTKTTMSHSLKVLEDRGFIVLKPSPEDGRAKQAFLTEAGRRFRDEAIGRVFERFGSILEAPHYEIMGRIRGDLEVIRKHLDENR